MRQFRHSIYQFVFSTGIVVASAAVTLVVLEIGLRLWDGRPILPTENFVSTELNKVVNHRSNQYDEKLGWAQVPDRRWESTEGAYTFGEYGTRMSNGRFEPLRQNAVLVVGDSFAGGSDVTDTETWPAQLEQMAGTQVINAAVGGYGLDQSILHAEELLPRLKPSMLIVQTNLAFGLALNRMSAYSGAPKPYFVQRDGVLEVANQPVPHTVSSRDIGWARAVFGYSYLVQYVMTRLDLLQWWVAAKATSNYTLSSDEGMAVSCLLMKRLRMLADRYRIPVVLVFQYGGPDGVVAKVAWDKDRAYVSACAEQQNLPVADIHEELYNRYQAEGLAGYQQLWVMRDGDRVYGHMSGKGNNLVARIVFQKWFLPTTSEAKPQ